MNILTIEGTDEHSFFISSLRILLSIVYICVIMGMLSEVCACVSSDFI